VHALPSLQGKELLAWVQPVPELQPSLVQTLPSSQFDAAPPMQKPPAHVSLVVHASPSSQVAELFVCAHPLAGMQVSVVHTLLSLQFGAGPPMHEPPKHASFTVHALPSLHGAVLFVYTHPDSASQLSSVQPLPSLHTSGVPVTHTSS
jgi:hypothetical protein